MNCESRFVVLMTNEELYKIISEQVEKETGLVVHINNLTFGNDPKGKVNIIFEGELITTIKDLNNAKANAT